jgi:hypothetical protein
MRDEFRFPTVRFRKCGSCGQVYTGSLTGQDACPKCHSPHRGADEASGAEITLSSEDGHILFSIRGTLIKLGELEELRTQIEKAQAAEAKSIAFALEGSSFLSSSLINLVVKTMQTLSVRGRPTFVITGDAETLESLQMMDLDRVLRILPDREAYLAALP